MGEGKGEEKFTMFDKLVNNNDLPVYSHKAYYLENVYKIFFLMVANKFGS